MPVGFAFAELGSAAPGIALRTDDGRHPTLAGTYLAACTFFAAFYAQSPQGLSYTAGLDQAIARQIQSAAWRAVSEFYGHDQ